MIIIIYKTKNSSNIDQDTFEDIYNFVIVNLEKQDFENSKYKEFLKVWEFESKYGKCHVIRAIYIYNSYRLYCDDYIAYIENNEGNHLGIFLKYREDMNGKKSNYIDYLKNAIPKN